MRSVVSEVLTGEFFVVGEHLPGLHEGEIADCVAVEACDGATFFVDCDVDVIIFVKSKLPSLQSKPLKEHVVFILKFKVDFSKIRSTPTPKIYISLKKHYLVLLYHFDHS